MSFINRESNHPNRKKIKIVSQSATEIIADIERFDEPVAGKEGTKITADVFNNFLNDIETAKTNFQIQIDTAKTDYQTQIDTAKTDYQLLVDNANNSAVAADTAAKNAETSANNAITTANSALSNSENAITTANSASAKSDEAKASADASAELVEQLKEQVKESLGTVVKVSNEYTPEWNADTKLDIIQGTENINKNLVINEEGSIIPTDYIVLGTDTKLSKTVDEITGKYSVTVTNQDEVKEFFTKDEILDLIFPVGTIIHSYDDVSPASKYGGTWEKLENRFLLGSGSSYTLGGTGGSATHKLTTSEMPSHTHTFSGNKVTGSLGGLIGLTNDTYGYMSGPFSYGGDDRNSWGGNSSWNNAYYVNFALTPSGSNSYIGGSGSHNNMPPYLVVNIWKRNA